MPSRNTYHLTWVSLALGVVYLFTAAPAKHSRCSLLWMRGISNAALPDLQRGMAPLGLPALVQPLLLGHWVAPCGCRPWHRAQGGSSWLPPFGHGIFPASTPDLVCGVAPLGGAYVRWSQPPALSVIKGKEIETVEVTASVQFSSVAQSCPTLCNPMNCSTPGLLVHHQLPEFTQIHVHRVST